MTKQKDHDFFEFRVCIRWINAVDVRVVKSIQERVAMDVGRAETDGTAKMQVGCGRMWTLM